ncbi:MAG: GNAT family N-acetyltransferase [Thermoleophilaceae bacterium]|nr:GNAT family N-acetyltransferase [Thermoleophilaceae bacterium]
MRSARAGFGPLLPDGFDWSAFVGGGERIAARIDQLDVRVAVADAGGTVEGYCVVGPTRDEGQAGGEVWTLFVDPGAWGGGAADRLLMDGLGWMSGRDADPVTVWSFVDNRRAKRFYERHAFRADGAQRTLPEFAGLVAERLARPQSATARRTRSATARPSTSASSTRRTT